MCKPCTTAAESRPAADRPTARRDTRNPLRIPNQLDVLTAIGRAMADAALVFDQSVNMYEWGGDGSIYATTQGCDLSSAVKRAAELCGAVADILHPHFLKRVDSCSPVPATDGNVLRHAAGQMDRLALARGFHDGYEDNSGREFVKEELYPELLAERSAKDPSVCPLCGSEREETMGHEEDGAVLLSWCCWACRSDVRKAKRVLERRRVNPNKPERAKKVKAKKGNHTPAPAGEFCLPLLGVLDCRTPAERAADDAKGVKVAPPRIPVAGGKATSGATSGASATPKANATVKPRAVKAQPWRNRIAELADLD